MVAGLFWGGGARAEKSLGIISFYFLNEIR